MDVNNNDTIAANMQFHLSTMPESTQEGIDNNFAEKIRQECKTYHRYVAEKKILKPIIMRWLCSNKMGKIGITANLLYLFKKCCRDQAHIDELCTKIKNTSVQFLHDEYKNLSKQSLCKIISEFMGMDVPHTTWLEANRRKLPVIDEIGSKEIYGDDVNIDLVKLRCAEWFFHIKHVEMNRAYATYTRLIKKSFYLDVLLEGDKGLIKRFVFEQHQKSLLDRLNNKQPTVGEKASLVRDFYNFLRNQHDIAETDKQALVKGIHSLVTIHEFIVKEHYRIMNSKGFAGDDDGGGDGSGDGGDSGSDNRDGSGDVGGDGSGDVGGNGSGDVGGSGDNGNGGNNGGSSQKSDRGDHNGLDPEQLLTEILNKKDHTRREEIATAARNDDDGDIIIHADSPQCLYMMRIPLYNCMKLGVTVMTILPDNSPSVELTRKRVYRRYGTLAGPIEQYINVLELQDKDLTREKLEVLFTVLVRFL
jgi:hypothetical protein